MVKRLYKSSITKRLYANILIIVLLFLVLILASNSLFLKPLSRYFAKKTLENVISDIEDIDFKQDEAVWLDELFALESSSTFDIMVFKDSELIYSSAFQPKFNNRIFKQGKQMDAVINNILKHINEDSTFSPALSKALQRANFVIETSKKDNFSFIVIQPLDPMNNTIAQANKMLIFIAGLFLIIAAFFAFKLSKSFTKPIKTIQTSVAKITELDFSEKCDVNTDDELAHLASDINQLSDKLKSTLNQLTHQNKQLEDDIISQRQFISNASHELRTPLSLIKGYVDEINQGFVTDDKQKQLYIDIISSETKKMSRLLKEMLDLSRMESGRMTLQLENLSVNAEILDFIEKYDGFIMDHDLNISLDFSESDDQGEFDKMRFEQILANYISNAAKYCDNDRIIKITTKSDEENIRISVFNSGKPIAENTLEHIWDRFYKKDLSGEQAETSYGLGLSIVAAIQSLTGQRFGAKNVDGGVEFWFDVKKSQENG